MNVHAWPNTIEVDPSVHLGSTIICGSTLGVGWCGSKGTCLLLIWRNQGWPPLCAMPERCWDDAFTRQDIATLWVKWTWQVALLDELCTALHARLLM